MANTRANLSPASHIGLATQINPRTVSKLALKWSYSTVGDVSATPTVEAGGLYVPDYAGYLYKLDPDTGALIWSHAMTDYPGIHGFSRNSPAIGTMGEIVLGVQPGGGWPQQGARVLAINKTTGAQMWQTVVDTNANAFVTSSPVIFNNRVYLGVASNEESQASKIPNFKPSFRGSVVALDEATGAIVWQFKTVPAGYAGGAVWGSSPVAWKYGNALLVGSGNNYAVPATVATCQLNAAPDNASQLACLDPTDYVDSLLSLDLTTGKLNWSRRTGADTWTVACLVGPAAECPTPHGLDVDFASQPNLVYLNNFVGVPDDRGGTSASYFIGAGQKSGVYWGINPVNGGKFFSTYVGAGQIVWGSAIDADDRNAAFVPLENHQHLTNVLAGRGGVPISWDGGAWASIALPSGAFNWQIPTYGKDLSAPSHGGVATGPITFSNRVMFAASTSGYMVGVDSTTGVVRWTFNAGGSVIGGPAIYNETVYWGAGATLSGPGSVHTVFAFAVPPTP